MIKLWYYYLKEYFLNHYLLFQHFANNVLNMYLLIFLLMPRLLYGAYSIARV